MGPKKKETKKETNKEEKKKKETVREGMSTEVERTFIENQLATLNRKVARLKTTVEDLEIRNEDLQKAYEKLDEDRTDAIAYLKKVLTIKKDEIIELKDKIKGLENIREIETKQFKETVVELEKKFTLMKDQLSAENKLLSGKLSTMDEFRAIRDDLMAKYEKQERDFEEQEIKYKRIIYEVEKKFVIGKEKLKKEMEARLLQLALDFQDASDLRIAASTHRVLRENIAINLELDRILASQSKRSELAEKYKMSNIAALIAKETAEEERDNAVNKNVVQLNVIKRFTSTYEQIKKDKALIAKKKIDFDILQLKVEELITENKNLNLKIRILEQNLHASITDKNKYIVESSLILKESQKLKCVLKDAANTIKAALKIDEWSSKDQAYIKSHHVIDRRTLLTQLLEIISQYREIYKTDSKDTLASFGGIYEAGDLGFIPKKAQTQTSSNTERRGTLTAFKPKESQLEVSEIKKSSSSSVHSSSLASLKTIPSVSILSGKEKQMSIATIASFVTSIKSDVSSDEGDKKISASEPILQDELEASKLNVRNSITKDFQFSRQSIQSKTTLKSNITIKSKSSISKETRQKSKIRADEEVANEPDKDKEVKDEADKDDTENDNGVKFEVEAEKTMKDEPEKTNNLQ